MEDQQNYYVIDLGMKKPPLSANDRMDPRQAARITKNTREIVGWKARAQKIPSMSRIKVWLEWRPATNRTRDASNSMPTQKACLDGLVDAGVVPDDDGRYVVEGMPRLLPVDKERAGVWLIVEKIG